MDEYSVRLRILHLEAHSIEAVPFDQRDSSYLAFGYMYLNVRRENEQQALEILKHYDE